MSLSDLLEGRGEPKREEHHDTEAERKEQDRKNLEKKCRGEHRIRQHFAHGGFLGIAFQENQRDVARAFLFPQQDVHCLAVRRKLGKVDRDGVIRRVR